jgi:uncharacterized protein with beta-barrel porin domain
MRLMLAALVVALAACNLPDQQVTSTVHLSTTGGATDGTCAMSKDTTWHLADQPEFAKYRSDIASATLTGARLRITSVSPGNEATRGSGEATLTAPDGSTVTLTSEGDVPIAAGAVVALAIDTAAAQRVLDAALRDPYTVDVSARARADRGPCLFSFDVELELSVTPKLSAAVE